ncbi:ribosomal protection-like ABC-F family protein [Alienimonas californiensis]|uniref:Putative ABC transporter ATP-binding protein YheS n=1 Tax=Alienimonas californiensis TaxID=2527989 RepID=A0A517P3I3_9PLAN|nr:ABC-F family ATP-binding cassette domain-containing protein [Alienimonas californiensis]QDT13934.1 putative ABC transporter ATP-binding protein YheS [Alienimonas californiensis]
MVLLSAADLSRQFDRTPVFKNVTFDVRAGERVGLVGPNGTGKTTLMHCLIGRETPDTGTVTTPQGATVGLLEQEAQFPPGRTLMDEAKDGLAHYYALHKESEKIAHKMAEVWEGPEAEKLHRRFDAIQEELTRHDAFELDYKVDEVLGGLGFTKNQYDADLADMSGGQRSRAILARLLLSDPDVMLLDEPTNHLDVAGTEWLESYLPRVAGAMIVVSHDRYFLDNVTTRTFELLGGTLHEYKGNFSTYRAQREERLKVLERTAEKQRDTIEKAERFVAKNRYGTKSKQAQSKLKSIARLEEDRVEVPVYDESGPRMKFTAADRTGDKTLEIENLSKGFGEGPLFENVSLRVKRGDRIGVVGHNGCGKTTFLKCVVGALPPDTGTVAEGANVRVGYFDQRLESVGDNETAVDAVRPPGDHPFNPGLGRGMLAKFGVKDDMGLMKVGAMSGGEKTRVALARLATGNYNTMVLDEPTNHLDLWSRDALERALLEFGGTLLFVSHDRYFMDRIATKVLVFTPEGVKVHDGNYSDYVAFRDATQAAESAQAAAQAASQATKKAPAKPSSNGAAGEKPKKYPYKPAEQIEAEIAETEEAIESLQVELAAPEVVRDGAAAKRVRRRYDQAKSRLAQLWEHLEEVSG